MQSLERMLWSNGKLQQEFSTGGNHTQRNGLICWSKIKPSLIQTPKPTAWQNSYRSNQREEKKLWFFFSFPVEWKKSTSNCSEHCCCVGREVATAAEPTWAAGVWGLHHDAAGRARGTANPSSSSVSGMLRNPGWLVKRLVQQLSKRRRRAGKDRGKEVQKSNCGLW